ncbi:MAG: hypothetical protein AB1758_09945, partial [Candidatus Eremiobacterota bacterium]
MVRVVRPLNALVSTNCVTLSGSSGSLNVTVRVPVKVAVSPPVETRPEDMNGACIPNRGSGLSVEVVTVPSGSVTVVTPVRVFVSDTVTV